MSKCCVSFLPIYTLHTFLTNHLRCRLENEETRQTPKSHQILHSGHFTIRTFTARHKTSSKRSNALPYIVSKVLIIFFPSCKMRTEKKQCNVIKIQKLTSRPKIKVEMTFDLFSSFLLNKLSKQKKIISSSR